EHRFHHQFTRVAVHLDGRRTQLAAPLLPRQARPAAAVSCCLHTDPNRKIKNQKLAAASSLAVKGFLARSLPFFSPLPYTPWHGKLMSYSGLSNHSTTTAFPKP